MSAMLTALGVDKMTVEERLRLIGEIWDSIPNREEIPFTEAQKAELDRRLERIRQNPTAGYTLEEFFARQRSAVE